MLLRPYPGPRALGFLVALGVLLFLGLGFFPAKAASILGDSVSSPGAMMLCGVPAIACVSFFVHRFFFSTFAKATDAVENTDFRGDDAGSEEAARLQQGISALADAVQKALADAAEETAEPAWKASAALREAQKAAGLLEEAQTARQSQSAQALYDAGNHAEQAVEKAPHLFSEQQTLRKS